MKEPKKTQNHKNPQCDIYRRLVIREAFGWVINATQSVRYAVSLPITLPPCPLVPGDSPYCPISKRS